MSRRITALLCLWILLTLSACGAAEEAEPTPPPPPPEEPIEQPQEDPIDQLLSSMTLEERVGQLFFVRCPSESAVEDIQTYHLGGYLLFGRDFKDHTANEIIQTIASYQDASAIPLLIGADEEGGSVVRVSSNPHLRSSRFPAPQKIIQSENPDIPYDLDALKASTRERDLLLRALGVNVNFAPVADVSQNPRDFIYDRTFGLDVDGTAACVEAVVSQMREDRMGSVLKHFPGYGDNVDTHTGIAVDLRPKETFSTERELKPFLACKAGEGTASILVSHNVISCMDPNLPASLSPAVHQHLRSTLHFDGVVMTDDLAMDAVKAYGRDGTAPVMALQGGNDVIVSTDYRTQIPQVLEAVNNGTLSEDIINTACRRVLVWKQSLGLLPAV